MPEAPHCQKCEIFMTLKDRKDPTKGWYCPKCGTVNRSPETKHLQVPIFDHFDHTKPPIGVVSIQRDALPKRPNWVLSLGYKTIKQEEGEAIEYEVKEMALIYDHEIDPHPN